MSQGPATAVIAVVVVAIVILAVWGWTRRTRRDATPLVATGSLPADAHVRATFEAFYVATTRHDEPLERIAAPGLGMRAKASVTVADEGVAIDLDGPARFVLTPDRILAVDQSTVAIDRVVEKDGLTRLVWRTDAGDAVDTYFRPQDASARALADAVAGILTDSPDSQTGSDA